MNPYDEMLIIIAAIAFAFSCWLVFWTQSAVKFAQSRQTGRNPGIAFEPWYPTWVRFEGIWMWVMIAILLSIAFRV